MMMSDDKVGGWVKKCQNHDDVILEWSLMILKSIWKNINYQVLRFQGNHKWEKDTISWKYLRKYMSEVGSNVHWAINFKQELWGERWLRILIGILASLHYFWLSLR